jgi:hypothetical protein
MPDGFDTSGGVPVAQRGFPRGGGRGFPRGGRFPGGGFRRFPRRFPIQRRFPIFFPIFYGFPLNRCYYIDQYGRCCDRYGRCCDRYGRCVYVGGYNDPYASAGTADSWYGMAGGWDMMPDMDDMGMGDYDDMPDYD